MLINSINWWEEVGREVGFRVLTFIPNSVDLHWIWDSAIMGIQIVHFSLLFMSKTFWDILIVLSSFEELSLLALEGYSSSSAQINSSSFVLRKLNLEGYCYMTVVPYANSHCYLFFFFFWDAESEWNLKKTLFILNSFDCQVNVTLKWSFMRSGHSNCF